MSQRRGDTGLALYTRVAHKSSATIIHEYSTSFGMAASLLDKSIRPDVENIYGLVRIADEIVDGAAAQAGLTVAAQLAMLDALEVETALAVETGYCTNLVVHSFAATARSVGIGRELTAPFFASMRRDLDSAPFTEEQVADYIYGSAEVIGLMCLRVFLNAEGCTDEKRARLEHGAQKLGSAFQKVNFLRDLSADWDGLHRNYFPTIDPERLAETEKLALLNDIDNDLAAAAAVIPELPANCRVAIDAAHGLFAELSARIRSTSAATLLHTRISVPNSVKLRILLRAKVRNRGGRTS
ncbi:MAG: squalene/phytoene synthase family protein [Lacisediminihabitans sp.]